MSQREKSVRLPHSLPSVALYGTRQDTKNMEQQLRTERTHCIPRQKTLHMKLVLVGDSAVGKSSLILRYVRDRFNEKEDSTIGACFFTRTVELNDTRVRFEIWDTAGQERYHSLAPMYYRGANAIVVVYDISSEKSYEGAKNWVLEIERKACNPEKITIALLGNKADKADQRVVDYIAAQTFAEDNNLMFMETSAKTSMNVKEIFLALATTLAEKLDTEKSVPLVNLPLDPPHSRSRFRPRCCSSNS